MKLTRTFAIALAITAGVSAQAVTLAVWNFNDPGYATGNTATADHFTVDRQVSGINASLSTTLVETDMVVFAGTTVNADSGDASGLALALRNGASGANNGATATFQFNTTGWQDLVLTYAAQRTSTGFNSQVVSYSTDGVTYTDFTTVNTIPLAFDVFTIDLSSVSELNNASSAYIRFAFDGGSTTSSAGNNRLDNIVLSGEAVPEPATMTLLGLGVAAMAARKRKKA